MKLLYKKRGFTLVELVVVIGIIGVLAAILIPTLMGMVAKAKVTSMNNTASTIRRNIDYMLMQSDPTQYGIIYGKVMILDITIKRENGKTVWTCTPAQSGTYNLNNGGGYTWGAGGTYRTDQSDADIKQGEAAICAALSERTGITKGAIVLVLHSGKCAFAAYTDQTNDPIPTDEYPKLVDGSPAASFKWNGETAGISPSGLIIGTAPVVPMGDD